LGTASTLPNLNMKEALDQHVGVPVHTQNQLSHQEPSIHKQTGYDNIKMRYLRSLNIPVPSSKKIDELGLDNSIASSAPIPIPNSHIVSKKQEESDEESEVDSELDTPSETRRRRNTGPNKFIPPHELTSADTGDVVTINHSLPSNYRRRNHIGI